MLLYHGCTQAVAEAIVERGVLPLLSKPQGSNHIAGFYMTDDIEVAKHYGMAIVAIEFEGDIPALVRPVEHLIDGEIKAIGMEYVLGVAGIAHMFNNLDDMYII